MGICLAQIYDTLKKLCCAKECWCARSSISSFCKEEGLHTLQHVAQKFATGIGASSKHSKPKKPAVSALRTIKQAAKVFAIHSVDVIILAGI